MGQHLGAVGGDGQLPDLEQFELLGQLQLLDEALGEQVLVFAAEGAEGIVIGMGVGGEPAPGHAVVGALLDPPAGRQVRRLLKVPVA
jgi:hypothetical protein